MPITKITFDNVNALSKRDVAYQTNPEIFEEFYQFAPDLQGLKLAIDKRSEFNVDRDLLVAEIKSMSKHIELTELQLNNINSLADKNTYTVITAHQPSLFTGPLYFVIKVLSTINLAKKLSAETSNHIVPVFIIGSEDHDFEEVNHMHIFNKSVVWESNQTGPVGRMQLNGLEESIRELKDILGESDHAIEINQIIGDALHGAANYNEFVLKMVNRLFGKYGVVVANMDNKAFKSAFSPLMIKEVIEQPSTSLIKNTQDKLEKLGFGSQAHARDINLFHLGEGYRERIVFEEGKYKVLNTEISWSEDEIITEIKSNSEAFSPNVVLRPLYQEFIWPNIAYVGGGGELAYWLERKSQFDKFNVFFPTLIRRNSLLILDDNINKTWTELGFGINDLFKENHVLVNDYLKNASDIEFDLREEYNQVANALKSAYSKAELADKGLRPSTEAEGIKILKQIDQIESRIKRSIKKQEERSLSKISKTLSKLFPNNGLQERSDNYFQFYLKYGEELMEALIPVLDPLEKEFVIYHS